MSGLLAQNRWSSEVRKAGVAIDSCGLLRQTDRHLHGRVFEATREDYSFCPLSLFFALLSGQFLPGTH